MYSKLMVRGLTRWIGTSRSYPNLCDRICSKMACWKAIVVNFSVYCPDHSISELILVAWAFELVWVHQKPPLKIWNIYKMHFHFCLWSLWSMWPTIPSSYLVELAIWKIYWIANDLISLPPKSWARLQLLYFHVFAIFVASTCNGGDSLNHNGIVGSALIERSLDRLLKS